MDEPLRGARRVLLELLRLLPKNAMSRLMGRFTDVRLPGPLQRAEIRLFARLTRVDLGEMRDEIDSFGSLQEFFTRQLRPEARPLAGDESTLVAPCDGAWGESGRIRSGTLVQVKGRTYRLADLLGDAERAAAYEGGCYATFYLSPRDYHRFHTPTAGRITRLDYVPGALWPVNSIGLHGVDGLFARNERICAELQPTGSDDRIVMVAVGATMVGSVRLSFDGLRTNVRGARAERRDLGDLAPVVRTRPGVGPLRVRLDDHPADLAGRDRGRRRAVRHSAAAR